MRSKYAALLFSLCMIALMSGCEPKASYSPPYLPVKFVVDDHGISVQGEASLVTPIGVFSLSTEYNLASEDDNLVVIIRDRGVGDEGFDYVYRIRNKGEQLVAVTNGKTVVEIKKQQVLIDVTDGNVQSIEFKSENGSKISRKWMPYPFGYKPFMLANWAYDDSTFEKWYGVGFVWFLVRLVMAAVLFCVDLCIIAILGPGVVLHSLFSETARNIYCGVFALAGLALGIFVVSENSSY